jgi:hypothetical protein
MRWLFVALFLIGCSAGNGGTDDSDCAPGCFGNNGQCLQCNPIYNCNSGGNCSNVTFGVACCDGTLTINAHCCANWSCNGNGSCQATAGANQGQLCGFDDPTTCGNWCNEWFPGNCTCSC